MTAVSFDWKSCRNILVIQGEQLVSTDPNAAFTTILGSCVSVCMFDVSGSIGGMNHFLLAEAGEGAQGQLERYGAFAMEKLINELLRNGANKARLKAKVFGGGTVTSSSERIGLSNSQFATNFLATEGIECLGGSTGGAMARRVHFHPTSGRARQFLVPPATVDIPLESKKPRSDDGPQILLF